MEKTRVLLADNHTLFREGLKALLDNFDGFEVVAEVGEGRECLQLIEKTRPDIVLLDISMPGLNGLEVAERALRKVPRLAVIFLSMYDDEDYVLQAISIGAKGYLLKEACAEELEFALKSVNRGGLYLTPAISRKVLTQSQLRDQAGRKQANLPVFDRLTARQREILQLIAEGCTTREISQKLGVSVKTAETHRTQLMKRLDIHDVAGLVRYAIRTGVIGV